MPRGKKTEEGAAQVDAVIEEIKEEVNEGMMNSAVPENPEPDEVTDPTMEGHVNPEIESVEENEAPENAPEEDSKEEKGAEVISEDVIETSLAGNFKVYRGRNYATITALASTVVLDGEKITENDVTWQPVVFTARSGRVTKGYIVI